MNNYKWLNFLLHIITATLYCTGFFISQQWLGFTASLLLILISLLPKRFSPSWMATILLVGFFIVTINGLLQKVAPSLLIAGMVSALALLEIRTTFLSYSESQQFPGERAFMKTQLFWLAVCCLIALLVCGVFLFIEIKISFFGMVVLGAIIAFLINKLVTLLEKDSPKKIG